MKINKNKSFFTKDIFNSHKGYKSSNDEIFIRVKKRKQGASIETIAKSRMSTSLKIYKFISDIFGIELRKISQLCRSKEGQKLIQKKDAEQQRHIKSNIEHINLRIGKLNKKLIFIPKVKTIPTRSIKPKKEHKKKHQDLDLGVPETKASSVDLKPNPRKAKKGSKAPIKSKKASKHKSQKKVTPEFSTDSHKTTLATKPKILRTRSVDFSPSKAKTASTHSAPPALIVKEEGKTDKPKIKKTKKSRKHAKTKRKAVKKARVKSPKYSLEYLSAFYRNEGKDVEGRTLTNIWGFSFKQKEAAHNYIQWLFPLPEKSKHNFKGPQPTLEMFEELNKDPAIRLNMLHSFKVMLNFYGLKLKKDGTVVQTKSFKTKKNNWLKAGDHNHLRISRIIRSMKLFGFEAEAQAFYVRLLKINKAYPGKVSPSSLKFWKQYAGA